VRKKPTQRFCGAPAGCRMKYHNKAKVRGLPLTPVIRAAIQEHAGVHDVTENEMACIMLNNVLNPDGRPLDDETVYGPPGVPT